MTKLVVALAALAAAGLAVGAAVLRPEPALPAASVRTVDFDDLPRGVRTGAQPSQRADGARHELVRCRRVGETDVVYDVRFSNPYPRTLRSIVAASIDGGPRGSVWGWFHVTLPAGRSRAVLDSRTAGARWRRWVRKSFRDVRRPEGCSAHLLGFDEGPRFKVLFPVAYRDFDA